MSRYLLCNPSLFQFYASADQDQTASATPSYDFSLAEENEKRRLAPLMPSIRRPALGSR
jgi:hypothetical protein